MIVTRRVLIVVPALLLVAVVLLVLAKLHFSMRPDVPLSDLLIDQAQLPATWETDNLASPIVDWDVVTRPAGAVPGAAAFSQASDAQSRSWGDVNGPIISETVFRYRTPILAAGQFWLAHPRVRYFDEYPNFSPGSTDAERYPQNWAMSPGLDQELIVCGMGNPRRCSLWFYRARYGQYIVSINFFAPQQGMSAADFARTVGAINTRVAQRLGES